MKSGRTIISALALLIAAGAPAQEKNLKVIHGKTSAQLRQIVERALGVAALDLMTGERFAINENLVFPQASAIKVAILMEVCKQAHEGKLKRTDLRRIEKKDKTGGSGVLVELGDGTVQLSIHDLCVLMILVSDNTTTNNPFTFVDTNASLYPLRFYRTRR